MEPDKTVSNELSSFNNNNNNNNSFHMTKIPKFYDNKADNKSDCNGACFNLNLNQQSRFVFFFKFISIYLSIHLYKMDINGFIHSFYLHLLYILCDNV